MHNFHGAHDAYVHIWTYAGQEDLGSVGKMDDVNLKPYVPTGKACKYQNGHRQAARTCEV